MWHLYLSLNFGTPWVLKGFQEFHKVCSHTPFEFWLMSNYTSISIGYYREYNKLKDLYFIVSTYRLRCSLQLTILLECILTEGLINNDRKSELLRRLWPGDSPLYNGMSKPSTL